MGKILKIRGEARQVIFRKLESCVGEVPDGANSVEAFSGTASPRLISIQDDPGGSSCVREAAHGQPTGRNPRLVRMHRKWQQLDRDTGGREKQPYAFGTQSADWRIAATHGQQTGKSPSPKTTLGLLSHQVGVTGRRWNFFLALRATGCSRWLRSHMHRQIERRKRVARSAPGHFAKMHNEISLRVCPSVTL